MFTGLIEEVGTVRTLHRGTRSAQITVAASQIPSDLAIGDSVAVSGVCLTVTAFQPRWFTADIMPETLERSALGQLSPGDSVNLERALRADGRLGGHIVTGHIDGVGTITAVTQDDNAIRYTVKAPPTLLRGIVEKGSIAIDGISLTVTGVTDQNFAVSVIPHTAEQTTLSRRKTGDTVNLETDILGKYAARLLSPMAETVSSPPKLTAEFLQQNGF